MIEPTTPITKPVSREQRIAAVGYDYLSQCKQPWAVCNLCGRDDWTVLTHRDRYGFPAETTACKVCGLAMINPRMTAAAYTEFYRAVYRPLVSAYHGRLIDAQTVQAEQQCYAEEMARLLAPFFNDGRGATFLDVGGSTGVVAAHFTRRFGLKAVVLDPAPDEIVEAQALGIETITSFVEDWNPQGRTFDLVGMFQTVDHLLDVKATLEKLRAVVASHGLFVVDIVDFRAAYLKNWSVTAATKIDHPFSLTEETIGAYLAQCGFAPVRRAYSEDRHLVSYVCRPCDPTPGVLPSPSSVDQLFREMRFVENTPSQAMVPRATSSTTTQASPGALGVHAAPAEAKDSPRGAPPGNARLRVLGVIPARGGSKELPGKNIRPLAGKPLIRWTYEAAAASGVLAQIILSTDDPKIAQTGRDLGLEAPFLRPAKFAQDDSSMIDVAVHALETLEAQGSVFDALLILQPTSPLRTSELIREAVRLLKNADSVCSVYRLPSSTSPHYVMKVNEAGFLDFYLADGGMYTRRQDAPVAYKRSGDIFLTRREVILHDRSFYGRQCAPLIVDQSDVVNIDGEADWRIAEERLLAMRRGAA